jgi:hypothetical protein
MYSLVSAPVLGFDLTRLVGGPATAEVILRAMRLTTRDLPVLAEHLPDDSVRAELWLRVEEAAGRLPTISTIGGIGGSAGTDHYDPKRVLDTVQRAPIGTVDGLLRCVRHDVMSWTWTGEGPSARQSEEATRATALLCDAAVASYLREVLPVEARRRLGAGWVAGARRLPPIAPIDLGPHHLAATALLDRVRSANPEQARRFAHAADDARRNEATLWSAAVHSSSWAAYLSDRIRTAAAAQLLLVQALDHDVITVGDRAGGVWNLLSGAVQAVVVRDLLDTNTAHRLLAPVIAVLGPTWLTLT